MDIGINGIQISIRSKGFKVDVTGFKVDVTGFKVDVAYLASKVSNMVLENRSNGDIDKLSQFHSKRRSSCILCNNQAIDEIPFFNKNFVYCLSFIIIL